MWHSLRLPSYSALLTGAAVLAVLSVPLGTRALVGYATPGFDEYEAFFLYASDIAVIFFLALLTFMDCVWLPRLSTALPKAVLCGGALLLMGTSLSLFFAVSLPLALYALARLVLGLLFAAGVTAAIAARYVPVPFFWGAFAASGVLEASLAFLQFRAQESLGLSLLGEPLLGPFVGGAAKIVVGGGALLRGYGTLPHPNVLAAFLLVAFLALSYFWLCRLPTSDVSNIKVPRFGGHRISSYWFSLSCLKRDISIGLGIFAVSFGIILSFSRSGWLAAGAAAALLVFGTLLTKELRVQAARLAILLFVICYLLFVSMNWAIFPRASVSRQDPAVAYRLRYNDLGLELAKRNPLGVGIGNQVLHTVRRGTYLEFGMTKRWQWQPVHNVYLLVAVEIGIVGLAGFIMLFGASLFFAARSLARRGALRLEVGTSLIMFGALLFLGLFDHYLWTLQPGRLLLWSVLGILLGLTLASKKLPS